LERRPDGIALHKVGRSQAPCAGRHAHACERKAKIYSLTFGSGEGARAKTKIKSKINFLSGGPGRSVTCQCTQYLSAKVRQLGAFEGESDFSLGMGVHHANMPTHHDLSGRDSCSFNCSRAHAPAPGAPARWVALPDDRVTRNGN